MSEKVFFPRFFLGTSVDFDQKSTWTASKKLSEEAAPRSRMRVVTKLLAHNPALLQSFSAMKSENQTK